LAKYNMTMRRVLILLSVAVVLMASLVTASPGSSTCVPLRWGAMILVVEDWEGRPLKNMLVVAYLKYVVDSAGNKIPVSPQAFQAMNFTRGDGVVMLYVPTRVAGLVGGEWVEGTPLYEVKVYWLDTPLLREKGLISRSIDIYDSIADPVWGERYYSPGEGGTIQAYIYTSTLRITTKNGKALPYTVVEKLVVEVTWPDGSITRHTVDNGGLWSDGSILLVMNSKTLAWRPGGMTYVHPDSEVSQAPPGLYVIRVFLDDREIGGGTVRITKGRENAPEIAGGGATISVAVSSDIKLKVHTPFSTPMSRCVLELGGFAVEPLGVAGNYTADGEGIVEIPYILLGYYENGSFIPAILKVNVLEWRKMPVKYHAEIEAKEYMDLEVPKIGKFVVKVVGSRGQGLKSANVVLTGVATIRGTANEAGVASFEVVEGSWTITAERGGKKAAITEEVGGSEEKVVTIRLDIFLSILGVDLSLTEFLETILLVMAVIIVTILISHEYSARRVRRLIKKAGVT